MHRILSLIAILALVAFAPAGAQERATNDTSALGRQAEGIPTDADPGQVQTPDPNVTTREGIEGERAGGEYAGQQPGQAVQPGQTGPAPGDADVTGQTGVTERAAQTEEREATTTDATGTDEIGQDDVGGAMPTTASALPLIGLAGLTALGLGLGLRAAARRS